MDIFLMSKDYSDNKFCIQNVLLALTQKFFIRVPDGTEARNLISSSNLSITLCLASSVIQHVRS
jgi:hypothetical protein